MKFFFKFTDSEDSNIVILPFVFSRGNTCWFMFYEKYAHIYVLLVWKN